MRPEKYPSSSEYPSGFCPFPPVADFPPSSRRFLFLGDAGASRGAGRQRMLLVRRWRAACPGRASSSLPARLPARLPGEDIAYRASPAQPEVPKPQLCAAEGRDGSSVQMGKEIHPTRRQNCRTLMTIREPHCRNWSMFLMVKFLGLFR